MSICVGCGKVLLAIFKRSEKVRTDTSTKADGNGQEIVETLRQFAQIGNHNVLSAIFLGNPFL